MSKRTKAKTAYSSNVDYKGIIGGMAVAVVFVVFIILWFAALFSPAKTPATANEVWEVIEEQGYEPQDYTADYHNADISFKKSLIKCVGLEKDDIYFQFFEFNNNDNARDIYGQAYHKITTTYNSWQKIETSYKNKNYSLYFLDSNGKYNVAIFVENTAVYAYCNSENKNEINKILDKIDYLTSGNNKETTAPDS